ncbi:MAG: DUF6242 domain-containing protein [Lachnoclostridium sp.]|nr:DUF6242 domain-containing protein [Lachnoclostridium sp.]
MNYRHPLYLVSALVMCIAAISCNSNSYYYSDAEVTSAAVTSFSLQKDDSVLKNLDSVFFSIDLINGRIFNADSLPKGTDVSRILLNIGTSNISRCNITYTPANATSDTTISYLASPNDSINFTRPVKLSVTSSDGFTTRDYDVKVNVHKVYSDTLMWDEMAVQALPTPINTPRSQCTVKYGDRMLCLTQASSTGGYLAETTSLFSGVWTGSEVTLPQGYDPMSFTATSDATYILGGDGTLYKSTDPMGSVWQSTGVKMSYIYGSYSDRVLGNVKDASGKWTLVTYPATTATALPEGMPVSGTSQLIEFNSRWSMSETVMFMCGLKADGTCSGDMWGYDGSSWAKISTTPVVPGQDVSICRYPVLKVNNSNWTFERRDVILAIGGRAEDGTVDDLVYMTFDEGITWTKAYDYLNLPEYFTPRAGAQIFVEEIQYPLDNGAEGRGWQSRPSTQLPPWAITLSAPDAGASRVVAPITSWTCPYIFMIGGYDDTGRLLPEIWRAVISRFTFNPLY